MKRLLLILGCVLTALFSIAPNALAQELWRPTLAKPKQKQITMTAAKGSEVRFSTQDLERRMGIEENELGGLTITSLPNENQGVLWLGNRPVNQYQSLTREQINQLVFAPAKAETEVSLGFIPLAQDAAATIVNINMTDSYNNPPVLSSQVYETMCETPLAVYLDGYDPEGDAIAIEQCDKPKKGTVQFDGFSMTYAPYPGKSGTDTFTIRAVDQWGNYSKDAQIKIKINKNDTGFRFADMHLNPSEYAAMQLHKNGVMTGEITGNSALFYPKESVKGADFLIHLLAAAGMDKDLPSCINTGLSNDGQIDLWLKPYVKKAMEEGIIKESTFSANDTLLRGQAVMYVSRAAKIEDVKMYSLRLGDLDKTPAWAIPYYMNLAAYKMLDLPDNQANATGSLTRQYSADLLWQLYKYCHK